MAVKTADKTAAGKRIEIPAPKTKTIAVKIRGTSPLVMHAFNPVDIGKIAEKQAAGSTASNRKTRDPKDFDALCEAAKHYSTTGWIGIPAMAFKAAMVRACSLLGLFMTTARMVISVIPDGQDRAVPTDGLVRITKGEPKKFLTQAKNANGGPDIRSRPMWDAGWEATLRIEYDTEQLTDKDILSLVMRAGMLGVLEGRANAKTGNDQGWGRFELAMKG